MSKTNEFLTELRTKTEGELESMLADEREELTSLRMDIAAGKVQETHKLGQTRGKIARIQTVLREVSIAEETSTETNA